MQNLIHGQFEYQKSMFLYIYIWIFYIKILQKFIFTTYCWWPPKLYTFMLQSVYESWHCYSSQRYSLHTLEVFVYLIWDDISFSWHFDDYWWKNFICLLKFQVSMYINLFFTLFSHFVLDSFYCSNQFEELFMNHESSAFSSYMC